MSTGNPRYFRQLQFTGHDFDWSSGTARLHYRFDQGPALVEHFHFPPPFSPSARDRSDAIGRALGLLHLIAGVSYYKVAVPPRVRVAGRTLSPLLAEFLNTLYVQGLAEFAYRNGLDLSGQRPFRAVAGVAPSAHRCDAPQAEPLPQEPIQLAPRYLVAMGGGKDSLVAAEALRRRAEVSLGVVGGARLISEVVSATGLPALRIGRRLDPALADFNRAGAWNGHVPVTAINSAALLVAALLYDFRHVVFANERSADEATLVDTRGQPVNHQYSKSFAFETAFRSVVQQEIGQGPDYFSLIRPLGELAVLQRFARLPQYHAVFSSCNRNFHLEGARIDGRWCGDCPKCRFTFLGLALFLPVDAVVSIFGRNLLDQADQLPGFKALCALNDDKPFECVGTVAEARAAVLALDSKFGWRKTLVVKRLVALLRSDPQVPSVPPLQQLLQAEGPHHVPAAVLGDVMDGFAVSFAVSEPSESG